MNLIRKPKKNNEHNKDLRHDLKNKLTVIQGYAELLLSKSEGEKEQKWAKEILNSSQELFKLIDENVR